jgi:hypothetical protein
MGLTLQMISGLSTIRLKAGQDYEAVPPLRDRNNIWDADTAFLTSRPILSYAHAFQFAQTRIPPVSLAKLILP